MHATQGSLRTPEALVQNTSWQLLLTENSDLLLQGRWTSQGVIQGSLWHMPAGLIRLPPMVCMTLTSQGLCRTVPTLNTAVTT